MTRKRNCIMAIFIAMILIITSFLCINTSLQMASAATYSDSGRYKFDFDIGLSILDGGTPTGYFRAYIYGNSTSSSTTTIPDGAVLKFSPKKLEIVIPKGSSSSYHQFYGRVYDVKITGPVSFSSPNVNNGSVSKDTTLTYNLSGLTDGNYTFSFTKDDYYYSNTSIGGTTSNYRNKITTTFSFKVDTSAPVISGAATTETGKYVNSSFTVTATDAGSGVSAMYMKSPDKSSYSSVGTSKTIYSGSTNGLYKFYAIDNAGYVSSTYYVYYDNVAPTLKAVTSSGETISSGGTTKDSFSVIASDSGSGINTLQYKTPNSAWQNYTSGAKIDVKGEQGTYSFKATDKSGNSTTYTVKLNNPCAAGHDYRTEIIKPTCTSGGYTVFTCLNCGDSYTDGLVAALGHSYTAETILSSCTEGGYTKYTCDRCGDSYSGNHTDPMGHSFSAVITQPTCSSGGFTTYLCSKCGYSYKGNETEAMGHSYVATTVPSSCTDAGSTTYKCIRCGMSYTDVPTQATGHNYIASITEPTCTERGYTIYTCTKCRDSYRDNETAPIGHNYMSEVIQATCTEKGQTIYTCTRCGNSFTGSVTEALGHTYISGNVSATCEEGGYTLHTCSKCGHSYRDNMTQTLGHNFLTLTKGATCTEFGKTIYSCQICGYEKTVQNGSYPTGHNYSNAIVKAPTCKEDGERKYVCDKCGDKYTEKIVAKGHSYAITDSHSENGKTVRTYTCTVCGDSYIQELDDQYEEVSTYVEELFDAYSPYMIWVFLGTAAIWSIVMGVFFAIAQKNEEKEKAKKMIVNYVIGLVVIFAILVACPYLVKGIAILVT